MMLTAPTRTIDNKVIKKFDIYDLMLNLFSIPNSPRHQNASPNSPFHPKYLKKFHLQIKL